jgi:PqqD family protein of HPr-rel-A system
MPPRYRADPPEARIMVDLEGMSAIFHRPSGITHLLASPAPEILALLSGEAGDAAEIAARLAARFEIEAEDAIDAVIADRLAELEAAGLIARA